jgi:hypothetical protein
MPLFFNTLLSQAGIDCTDVRLLRHQDNRLAKGSGPYELWRDDRPAFDHYQASQRLEDRPRLTATHWASFVVTPDNETMLAGFYLCRYVGMNTEERWWPGAERMNPIGTCDIYELTLDGELNDFVGRLIVEWGAGKRTWIQRADNQNKTVLEIRRSFEEPDFPGFANFIVSLSKIEKLPTKWVEVLRSRCGIYLLTCPRTKEQYVGLASSDAGGFYGRWLNYARDGHGGNVELKSRDPSDYQVSILQVAGDAEIPLLHEMESRWKQKLQSREMGLNRN